MEPKYQTHATDAESTFETVDEDFLEEPESWDVDDFNDILDMDDEWPF